jgi:threonine synthase
MWGFQAAGAAPLVRGEPVPAPETIATAIRIGNPASWELAIQARDATGGMIDAVTDQQIVEAYQLLAAREGLFVELASAAGVAGLLAAAANGRLDPGQRVVVTLTGHGLKDPDAALARSAAPARIPAEPTAAAHALDLA